MPRDGPTKAKLLSVKWAWSFTSFEGHRDISVGNIVGSNIFNLGIILVGCALVRAIPISTTLLLRDGTVLGGATLLRLATPV